MQFRERRRVIQVIRTTYDPELKRGRSEVVGKIDKALPAITDKLQKACTPEERDEVAAYLDNRRNALRNEAVRAGAETLPAQMRAAAEYFLTHRDGEAKEFAAAIRAAWDELKGSLNKAGFSKGKVLKKGVTGKAAAVSDVSAVEEPAQAAVEDEVAEVASEAAPEATPEATSSAKPKKAPAKPRGSKPVAAQSAAKPALRKTRVVKPKAAATPDVGDA